MKMLIAMLAGAGFSAMFICPKADWLFFLIAWLVIGAIGFIKYL